MRCFCAEARKATIRVTGRENSRWAAGNSYAADARRPSVDGNTITNVAGPGIWCDIGCETVTFSNNRVKGTVGPGLFYEISDGCTIRGNTVEGNGDFWPAIYVASSGNVEVASNVVTNAGRGLQLFEENRGDRPASAGTNVFFHDNSVIAKDGAAITAPRADSVGGHVTAASSHNRSSNNRYWYPVPEDGQTRVQLGLAELWEPAWLDRTDPRAVLTDSANRGAASKVLRQPALARNLKQPALD